MAPDPNPDCYHVDNSMSPSTRPKLSPASPRSHDASPAAPPSTTSPVLNEMFARSAQSGNPSPRMGQLSGDILSRMVTASGAGGAGVMPFRVASMHDFRRSASGLKTVPESSRHTLRARQPDQAFARTGQRRPAAAGPRPMSSENPLLKMMEQRMAAKNSLGVTPSPPVIATNIDNEAALQASINKWAGVQQSSSSVKDEPEKAKPASNGRTVASPRIADNETPVENPLLKMMEQRMAAAAVIRGQPLPTIAASPSPPLPQMSVSDKAALQASINKWGGVGHSSSTDEEKEQKKIEIKNSFKSESVPATNASSDSTGSGLPAGRVPLSPHQIELLQELTASQNLKKDEPISREEMLQQLLHQQSNGVAHNPMHGVQRVNGLGHDLMNNLSQAYQFGTIPARPALNRCAVSFAEVDRLRKENQYVQLMRERMMQEQRMKEQQAAYLHQKAVAASALVSLQNDGGRSMAQHDKLTQMQACALNQMKNLSSSSELNSLLVGMKSNKSSNSLRKRRSVRMDEDDSTCGSQGSHSTNTHSMTSASSSNKVRRSLSHCSARAALSGSMENLRIRQSRTNALGSSGNRNESFSSGLNSAGRCGPSSVGLRLSNGSFSTTSRHSTTPSTKASTALKRSSSSKGWVGSLLSEQNGAGGAAAKFQIAKTSDAGLKSLLSEQKSAGDAAKTFQLVKNSSNSLVSLSHGRPSLSMKESEVVLSKPIQVRAEEYDPPAVERPSSSINCDKVIISAVPDRIKYHNAKADTKPIDVVKEALSSRGAKSQTKPTMDVEDGFFVKVAEMYDQEIVNAIRSNDVDALRRLHAAGTNLQCGNRFGETLIHLACRRSRFDLVSFLVAEVGLSLRVRDDFGRTPLHDACWRTQPDLELLDMLLDRAPELLMLSDKRGHTPLDYARREHWAVLVPFLLERADKFRPVC